MKTIKKLYAGFEFLLPFSAGFSVQTENPLSKTLAASAKQGNGLGHIPSASTAPKGLSGVPP